MATVKRSLSIGLTITTSAPAAMKARWMVILTSPEMPMMGPS
jgi:hypothetical protein